MDEYKELKKKEKILKVQIEELRLTGEKNACANQSKNKEKSSSNHAENQEKHAKNVRKNKTNQNKSKFN